MHAGGAAYSDLALYGEDTIAVVAGVGDAYPYERIELIPFSIADVDGPAEALPPVGDLAMYAGGRLVVDERKYQITSYCLSGKVRSVNGKGRLFACV